MRRLIAIVLALSLFVCAFTACKGDEEGTTVELTEAYVSVEVTVATVNENGEVSALKTNDGEDIVINGTNGEQVVLSQDNILSTVTNAAGSVSGIRTVDGYIIPVKQLGDKLVVIEENNKCEIQLADEVEEETTTQPPPPPATTKPTAPKPIKPKPTEANKTTTTLPDNELEDLLGEAGISKKKAEVLSKKILSYMVSEDGYFYTDGDPWQRNFGFNPLYDLFAPLTFMWYDTVRVKFSYPKADPENNVKGLDWMIQMWKGQYGFAFTGSEIGVYTKDPERKENHYDCASNEHMLGMEMTLYHFDEKVFTRPKGTYWWITGFVPRVLESRTSPRSELTMIAKIDFFSAEMANLFAQGLKKAGFYPTAVVLKNRPETYVLSGKSVEFVWKNIDQKLAS